VRGAACPLQPKKKKKNVKWLGLALSLSAYIIINKQTRELKDGGGVVVNLREMLLVLFHLKYLKKT